MTDVASAKKMIKQALELLMMANEALGTEPSIVPDVLKYDKAKPPELEKPQAKFKNAEDLRQTFPPDLRQFLTVTEATEHYNVKTRFVSVEKWEQMNEIANMLDGKWIKDGRESRWQIPK